MVSLIYALVGVFFERFESSTPAASPARRTARPGVFSGEVKVLLRDGESFFPRGKGPVQPGQNSVKQAESRIAGAANRRSTAETGHRERNAARHRGTNFTQDENLSVINDAPTLGSSVSEGERTVLYWKSAIHSINDRTS